MRSIALGIFIVATIAPLVMSARAETVDPNSSQVWTQCRSPADPGYVSTQNLAGCTALIESGQLSTLDRATAFEYRAMARSDLNQLEQALADFIQAKQLDSEILSRLHIVSTRSIEDTRHCDRYYPDEARKENLSGEAIVGYDVGKRGEVTNVHVLKSSGAPLIDQAALNCASHWRNTPGMIDGTPFVSPGVNSVVNFSVADPEAWARDCLHGGSPTETIVACYWLIRTGLKGASLAGAFNNIGGAYMKLGQFQAAIQYFDSAIKNNPDDVTALVNRGISNQRIGHFDLARKDLDKALSLKPDTVFAMVALEHRCWLLANEGQNLDAALADCNKSIEIEPKNAGSFAARAFVYYRMQKYEGAIADATSALALDPKSASSLYLRGLAQLKTGNKAGAASDIAEANALDPKVAQLYASYGSTP